jgi:hypothetical protein
VKTEPPERKPLNSQGLTEPQHDACPCACPCDEKTVHAGRLDRHQDNESEGDADRLDGLPLDDLDRLAAELRTRLTLDECRQLAVLLTL